MKTFTDFLKEVINEDINQRSEITTLPRMGNLRWGFLLIPNYNNFIYHTLRQLNGQHNWRNIERMLVEKLQGTVSRLSSLIESKAPVTLAIPMSYSDIKTIVLYPNAIIDSVEGDYVIFHLDPRQYRMIKDKFGFNVQTTSLSLQYIKKHPDNKTIMNIEHTNSTTGFEIQKGDKYWYKVYGREKGQLHKFAIDSRAVLLWEDLQEIYNTAIDWYDIQSEVKYKKEAETKAYNSALYRRGQELYAKKEQFNQLYNQVFNKKSDSRIAFLDTLSIQQLKDIQAYAYYRYANHYDIYELEHKKAEYAEDWHYDSQKRWLQNIREKDHSITYEAKKAIARKGN